jgi:uncharacterized protein (TIGR02598 family)
MNSSQFSVALKHHSHGSGFSLVETALALGVIAFALTALVALLPGGLAQFRNAMDVSIGAQIYQRVVTDLEQAEFDTLLAADAAGASGFRALPTRFFDEQGDEVAATELARIVYQVRVRISPPGPAAVGDGAPGFTSLPAAPGEDRFAPRDAVFLTIQIAHNPRRTELPAGPQGLWLQPSAQASAAMLTYSAIITRNGHTRGNGKG